MAARQAIGESTAAWRARGGGSSTVASRTSSSGVSLATRRYVSGLFKEAKAMYAPGGGYMKGIEAQLKRGGEKAVATGMQNLAAGGLASTSMAGGLGLKYEEDVATPARATAETQRMGALAGLLQAEAGAISNLATRYSTSPGGYGGGGGGGGASYAPRPVASATRQPAASATSTARLKKFPAIFGKASSPAEAVPTLSQGTGYKGVYFGKAYYDLPASERQATISRVS